MMGNRHRQLFSPNALPFGNSDDLQLYMHEIGLSRGYDPYIIQPSVEFL